MKAQRIFGCVVVPICLALMADWTEAEAAVAIGSRWELSVKRNHIFEVNYQGRKNYYREVEPVYDRHTLDFVLRGFSYHK
ncbi:MAG: hypothetical protein QHJ82_17560, partial [Verrucomicrobiota bacterium]|nr:hypothetical protein [Verrucomicrobiota bacterium]